MVRDSVVNAKDRKGGDFSNRRGGGACRFSARLQKPVKEFRMIVDRPFFALIRHDLSRTILFMGWIDDPQ
jgi:serine protease inhibitor